jgi:hypothetical protein
LTTERHTILRVPATGRQPRHGVRLVLACNHFADRLEVMDIGEQVTRNQRV